MWIIDWLLERFEKLLLLLDTLWDSLKDLAEKGWTWIDAQIRAWVQWLLIQINDAKSYVLGLLNDTADWLRSLIEEAKTSLTALIDNVSAWVSQALADLRAWAEQAINNLSAWVSQALNDLRDYLLTTLDNVRDFLTGLINDVRASLLAAIEDIRTFFTDLIESVRSILAKAIQDLTDVFNAFRLQWEGLLHTLFDNPALFIFSIIEAWVYTWAEWFLAQLLGSVNDPLPPRPDLFGGGAGDGGGGGGGQPGSGNLIYPSAYTTISGYTFGPNHPGVDFGTPLGVPIWAADGGTVVSVQYLQTGYGYHVDIDHGNGYTTRYAHLSAIYVTNPQPISQHQTIGAAGSTGNSTGPHLHFEVRYDGTPVNPLNVLR